MDRFDPFAAAYDALIAEDEILDLSCRRCGSRRCRCKACGYCGRRTDPELLRERHEERDRGVWAKVMICPGCV